MLLPELVWPLVPALGWKTEPDDGRLNWIPANGDGGGGASDEPKAFPTDDRPLSSGALSSFLFFLAGAVLEMLDDDGVNKKGLELPAAEDGGFEAIPWNGEGTCNEEGAPRLRLEQKENTEQEMNVKYSFICQRKTTHSPGRPWNDRYHFPW